MGSLLPFCSLLDLLRLPDVSLAGEPGALVGITSVSTEGDPNPGPLPFIRFGCSALSACLGRLGP